MKKLLFLALLGAVSPVLAASHTIVKTVNPPILMVFSTGTGSSLSQFSLLSSDFPSGTLNATKKLSSVNWRTSSYPTTTGERAELCYSQPYSSTEVLCIPVALNSAGSTDVFNNYRFDNGVRVVIRHVVTNGTPSYYHSPAGQEQVSFTYSY
ncbi:hypothetical protein [Photorhabdus cinerea]|uniref:hypothetical protein n=1 Tax=Photorhabdus cinerea TaxID=471575 RepID=UPI00140DCFCA|nr:hypothetical protein [Photorhabdus cinerea]